MADFKKKVYDIKLRYAKNDKKSGNVFLILLILGGIIIGCIYFLFGENVSPIIPILCVVLPFIIAFYMMVKNYYLEIIERIELLEDEVSKIE